MAGSQAMLVYLTFGSSEDAERIAFLLVQERLAACVNLIPKMRSIYRWRESIESAEEIVGIAKTTADKFEALRAKVRLAHTYETPCIVGWKIDEGDADYLAWIAESVK
jgi:periplasmic divalent cation tolerance protein